MLRQKQSDLFFREERGLMSAPHERAEVSHGFGVCWACGGAIFGPLESLSGEAEEPDDTDAPLDDAARSEREYVRRRLREELKREPTEDELDEWLRQHTEGY
jgi:hypothetical protein